jgi:transcriptional regulator with XRE-family HTH domain
MTSREFGQRVYRLRMAKGWTQEVCAGRGGLSTRTLQKIEAYRMNKPPVETVRKLAEAFRCDWKELLGPVDCPVSVRRK